MLGAEFPLNTATVTIRPTSGTKAGRPPDVWTGPATTTSADLSTFLAASDTLFEWAKNNNKIPDGQKSAVLDFVLTCYAATSEKLSEIVVRDIRIDFRAKKKKRKSEDLWMETQRRSVQQDQLLAEYVKQRDTSFMQMMQTMHQHTVGVLNTLGQQIVGVVQQQVEQQKAVLSLATQQMEKAQDAHDILITELKMQSISAQKTAEKVRATVNNVSALDQADKALGMVTKLATLGSSIAGNGDAKAADRKDPPKLVAASPPPVAAIPASTTTGTATEKKE